MLGCGQHRVTEDKTGLQGAPGAPRTRGAAVVLSQGGPPAPVLSPEAGMPAWRPSKGRGRPCWPPPQMSSPVSPRCGQQRPGCPTSPGQRPSASPKATGPLLHLTPRECFQHPCVVITRTHHSHPATLSHLLARGSGSAGPAAPAASRGLAVLTTARWDWGMRCAGRGHSRAGSQAKLLALLCGF